MQLACVFADPLPQILVQRAAQHSRVPADQAAGRCAVLRFGLVSLLILSHVSVARGEEPKVLIDTRFVQLGTTLLIASQCGDHNANAYACSQFVATQFSARCAERSGVWTMAAWVRTTAYVFLVDRKYRQHELLHIRDMKEGLSEYITTLEARKYQSPDLCEADAASANKSIHPLMREFAASSNLARH